MDGVLILQLVAVAVLFACSALFAMSETVLFSLDTIRLSRIRRSHTKAADRIEQILASPKKILSTILIGNTLVNVVVSTLGYSIIVRLAPAYAEMIAVPVMLILLLLFGEITPKRVAIRRPERLAVLISPALRMFVTAFSPLRFLLDGATSAFEKIVEPRRKPLSGDEFLTALVVGEEEGILDKEERSMVDGIVRLGERQVSDVMTPRVDMVGIDMESVPEEYEPVAKSAKFRYIPVYRGTLDNIESMLDCTRYLLTREKKLSDALIVPYYVPETMKLNTLLAAFQKEDKRAAIVVDEYGGTAGLVSRSDVIEEIVAYAGEQRGAPGEPPIEPAGRNCWLVNGAVSLEDINRKLGLDLRAEGADRIAGWVIASLGRIPKAGEKISGNDCTVTVKRVRKNRITLVSLCKERGSRGED